MSTALDTRAWQDLDTRAWQDLDARHYLHPFTDHKTLRAKGSRIITKAEGVYLWDSDGHQILDGMAGLWNVNVGYGREELVEAAAAQLRQMPYYNSFFQTAHPPAITLAKTLAELAPPGLEQVFFTSSGSEANDTVVRLVRHFFDLQDQPQRKAIIGRHNGYHGSTVAAASLGGMKPMHAQGGLPIPDIHHIPQPYWYGEGGDLSPEAFGEQCAKALEDKILELGPDRVAAFIGEPIQGAGGMIIPPPGYWPAIQAICRRYGVLLVLDEVISAFGRIGHWFASEYYGLEPDLITFAKGITSGYFPLGGVLVGERVASVLESSGQEFYHGYTYSGHPAACAVALANLKILRDEGLVERIRHDTGPYLQARWRELAEHPLVGEARGLGFLGALELVKDKAQRTRFEPQGRVGFICRDHCFAQGLVMRSVQDTMIISPPLIAERHHIDELVAKARRCLDLTAADLAR
ncbi:MAG: aspartate aminotransferase family protein [Candidatus Competibacterales bacterium]